MLASSIAPVPGGRPASDPSSLESRQIRERVRGALFRKNHDRLRYQIRGKLGAGGMGVVYRAYDPILDCEVALKQLSAECAGNPSFIQHLQHEAQMMAKLRQKPHIVTLYDFFAEGETVFVVMELVDGPNLRSWQMTERPWRDVLDVYLQAGRGLHLAHDAGLVHRDFKPENVLLADGIARVADFGLAQSSAHPSGAATGALSGTLYYMAPERLTRESDGPASDQFSYCVALYEALYGQHPMLPADSQIPTMPRNGTQMPNVPTNHPLAEAILRGTIHQPARATNVPRHILHALRRGMSRAPNDRFASMHDLLGALSARPARRRALISLGLAATAVAAIMGSMVPSPPTRADHVAEAQREIDALDIPGLRQHLGDDPANLPLADELARRAVRWVEFAGNQRFTAQQILAPEHSTRLACLDTARDRLAAFTTALREADQVDPVASDALLDSLPDPAECVIFAEPYLRCRIEEAGELADLRAVDVLAAIRAAEHRELAGDHAAAIDLATLAASRAEGLALDPNSPQRWRLLRSHVDGLRGRLHQLGDQPREALDAFQKAYDRIEARECLDLRFEIASRAVKVAANNPSVPKHVGEHWLRTERNLGPAFPDGGRRQAIADNDAGLFMLKRRDQPAAAIPVLTAAMDLRATIDGDRPTAEQADTLLNLGDAYHEQQSFELARRTLEAAVAQRTAVSGADHPLLWREWNTLGHVDLDSGASEQALARFERAHVLAVAGFGEHSGPAATMLLAQATALRVLERHDDAVRVAKQADAASKDARMDPILRTEIQAAAGILLVDVNDAAGAVAVLQPLADATVTAPELLEVLPLVWLNLGQALAHNKDVVAAERRASDLIAWLDSPGAPSNDEVLAGALRLRGKVRYGRDRNRDASLDFTRLLNLPASDRDLAEARILLGLSLEPRDRSTVCKLIHQAELDLAKLPTHDDALQTMFDALPKGCPK